MSKNLKVLGTGVLLIGLAVAGWFLYTVSQSQNGVKLTQDNTESQKQEQRQVAKNDAEEGREQIERLKTEDIDISNWKTYRNEEYGFEIKLPGDPKKWRVNIKRVDKAHSKFNSNKHYIIWFNYPLDQKILRSKNQPEMGYITSMSLWYIEVVDVENYQKDACELRQISKCRIGDIIAKNDEYVFISGFPNLSTPCALNNKEVKSQEEFCYVDFLISSKNMKKYIDFKFVD